MVIIKKIAIWYFKDRQIHFCFIFLGNCYSHILHNSVKHAHRLLSIDVEQILLSIYSHFSRSAKRIDELKHYYEFYEQDFKVRIFLTDQS